MSKGMTGEDLPATIITVLLIFVFIFSMMVMYSNYISQMQFVEMKRSASSMAELVVINNSAVLCPPQKAVQAFNSSNALVKIVNAATGTEWSAGNVTPGHTQASSSLAAVVCENGKYYPGRVEVYVA